jgi:hypothetical protein
VQLHFETGIDTTSLLGKGKISWQRQITAPVPISFPSCFNTEKFPALVKIIEV